MANRKRLLRPRVLIPIGVALVVVLIVVLSLFAYFYTQLLFFRSVGFAKVFDTEVWTKIVLFVLAGLVFPLIVSANVIVAHRLRPKGFPRTAEQLALDQARSVIDPFKRWILLAVAIVIGLFVGSSATHRWQTVQMWLHSTPFHVKDPQFHRDISYYVFTYPLERTVIGYGFAVVIVSLVASLAVHYLYGGIQPQTRRARVTPAARAHISVLLGVFVMFKAASYYLDRFGLNFSPRGSVTGAGYSDIHAALPAKTVLLIVAVICAGLFFANVRSRGFALPIVAFGLLVISAIIIGGVYPAIVQTFTVKPNELNLEAPYIQRNIDATQAAYQLVPESSSDPGGVEYSNYSGTATPSPQTVASDTSSIPYTRLLDPSAFAKTFEQLQQIRSYYTFPTQLDVDRYTVNGQEDEYLVGLRDINLAGLPSGQQNWPNEHLVYTHGDGFIAAPVNTVDSVSDGRPLFADGDIPPAGPSGGAPEVPVTEPRIYFGQNSPSYSIVHTTQDEIDGADQTNYSYTGDGGVSIGSEFRRIMFAVRFRDRNIVLSSSLTSQSRIMYYRDPVSRVENVAPWLTTDSDPYPAVVDGQILWIVDCYTTTDLYPYSERTSLASATSDTNLQGGNSADNQINYIRNSVKATVNAFTGAVTLYAWEPTDPILQTWEKIFPGTVQPYSSIPPALEAHFRYPEDLFNVQRSLIGRYHISNAKTFYRGNDFWSVPTDPTNGNQTAQPPYYELMQVPGQAKTEFDLTSDMVANGRPNLAAFIAVSSDAPDYGIMRVLQLPTGTSIQGPANVSNIIETNRIVSTALTPLRLGGSKTVSGNLLTIPLDGGFLFVQPIYVQATASSQTFPTLQEVAVDFSGNVGFAPTLSAALVQVLGAAPPGTEGGAVTSTTPSGTTTTTTPPGKAIPATVRALITKAQAEYTAAQSALRGGNFALYGTDEQQLQATLQALATAAAK